MSREEESNDNEVDCIGHAPHGRPSGTARVKHGYHHLNAADPTRIAFQETRMSGIVPGIVYAAPLLTGNLPQPGFWLVSIHVRGQRVRRQLDAGPENSLCRFCKPCSCSLMSGLSRLVEGSQEFSAAHRMVTKAVCDKA